MKQPPSSIDQDRAQRKKRDAEGARKHGRKQETHMRGTQQENEKEKRHMKKSQKKKRNEEEQRQEEMPAHIKSDPMTTSKDSNSCKRSMQSLPHMRRRTLMLVLRQGPREDSMKQRAEFQGEQEQREEKNTGRREHTSREN